MTNKQLEKSGETETRNQLAQTGYTVGLTTSVRPTRKYALLGVGVFFLGFLLGALGSVAGLAPIVPFADALVLLGFVLSVYGLVLAAGSLLEIVAVGVMYGLGEFYKGQDHGTHIASGIGLGLIHEAHIFIGLLIMASATIIAAALAFHHTKAKRPR